MGNYNVADPETEDQVWLGAWHFRFIHSIIYPPPPHPRRVVTFLSSIGCILWQRLKSLFFKEGYEVRENKHKLHLSNVFVLLRRLHCDQDITSAFQAISRDCWKFGK